MSVRFRKSDSTSDARCRALALAATDRAESVVWNDGSLGCPEPEMMYTQALVNGYWVVIDASGQNYDFRVDNRGNFRLCPPGPRPSSITAYRKLTPGAAVRRREQLQRRVA